MVIEKEVDQLDVKDNQNKETILTPKNFSQTASDAFTSQDILSHPNPLASWQAKKES